MPDPSIEKALLDEIHHLQTDQQKKVLEFARTLSQAIPTGTPGKDLLRFAGVIDKTDLKKMAQTIQEDCERIDSHEW